VIDLAPAKAIVVAETVGATQLYTFDGEEFTLSELKPLQLKHPLRVPSYNFIGA